MRAFVFVYDHWDAISVIADCNDVGLLIDPHLNCCLCRDRRQPNNHQKKNTKQTPGWYRVLVSLYVIGGVYKDFVKYFYQAWYEGAIATIP